MAVGGGFMGSPIHGIFGAMQMMAAQRKKQVAPPQASQAAPTAATTLTQPGEDPNGIAPGARKKKYSTAAAMLTGSGGNTGSALSGGLL